MISQAEIDLLENEISLEEYENTLCFLPNNKASGTMSISYNIIKLFPLFHKRLRSLFNTILSNETLPNIWQEAFLFPIPKST